MNKKWIILVGIIIILIGGYKIMEKQKINAYVERQKPRIEKYLKYNYNNVESVIISNNIEKNPMGGFFIDGYINNDPNIDISVAVSSYPNDIEYVSDINGDFYDKYKKENLKGKSKSVSEIIEEEKQD